MFPASLFISPPGKSAGFLTPSDILLRHFGSIVQNKCAKMKKIV